MNLQEINLNRLDALGIYELRELGRRVGVTRPTALRRGDLVARIKEQIAHGDVQKAPVRGRKPRGINIDMAKIASTEESNSYFNSVLAGVSEPQVRGGADGEERAVSGYMHLLPSGNAVLVGLDLNGYPALTKVMRENCLKTGDYVDGKAVYQPSRSSFMLERITKKSDGVRFDALEGLRPDTACTSEFQKGERVLIVTPKPFDRLNEITRIANTIKSAHTIALLIDETDDSAKYLQDSGIQDVYLTKVNYNIQKQTLGCLLALFRAKEFAEKGENVILFVDSFNKLFKIYNNSAYPDGRIDPNQINLGPLVDLKTFLLSARALKNGGSLTVVGFINSPSGMIEDYVYNEFTDLAQKVIKK
jgi:transcription termination factor Rho